MPPLLNPDCPESQVEREKRTPEEKHVQSVSEPGTETDRVQ